MTRSPLLRRIARLGGIRGTELTTAEDWSRFLGWTLEILALGALAATNEVSSKSFMAAGFVLLLSQLFRRGVNERWVVGFLFASIVGTFVGWRLLQPHPIVAVAHAAPVAHSFLWFAPPSARYRGWRLGIGMVELILAATLSSEAYLPLAIIVFLILGSVALSCNFLDAELRREAPSYVSNPLPRKFIRKSLGLSLLLVVSSVVIFPILPRTQTGLQMFGTPPTTGYTEGVRVSEWHTFDPSQTGSVIMRLYPPESVDLTTEIYLGLIRGRVLDRFDGKEWKPAPDRKVITRPIALKGAARMTVEGVREPIRTDVLPVPYGTSNVLISIAGFRPPANRTTMNEWVAQSSINRRVEFSFDFRPNDLTYLRESRELDRVLPEHTEVPPEAGTDALKREAAKIFAGAKTHQEKIARMMLYFREKNFSPVGTGEPQLPEAQVNTLRKLSGLEEFLFVRKSGHCEWFASAAATLLRLGGVPTRLIAGFRLNKGQVGGVLTVRNSDAHAWLEAWNPDRGWIPVDPTPRVMTESTFQMLSDAYDVISAYWFRWIVSYDMSDFTSEMAKSVREGLSFSRIHEASLESIQERKGMILTLIGAALAAAGAILLVLRVWFPHVFSIRWRVHEGPPALRRERMKMERLLRRQKLPELHVLTDSPRSLYPLKGADAGDSFVEWLGHYQTARFGRPRPSDTGGYDATQALNERYLRFKRSVAN